MRCGWQVYSLPTDDATWTLNECVGCFYIWWRASAWTLYSGIHHFLLLPLKPGSPTSWSRSTFDRSSAWFLADLPPHCFPWLVEISRRKGVPPALKPTPLLPWLFLPSSLLTFQDFSLKVIFPPHPRKLGAVALNDPWVSCWFLGAHFHVWIGLLKSGNIHLSFTCVWSYCSVWGQDTDSVQPPDQCWAQKTRWVIFALAFPLTKLTLGQSRHGFCDEFVQHVWPSHLLNFHST